MLTRTDIRDDTLLMGFDEITRKLREYSEKYNIDLSKIRIRMQDGEPQKRLFYN